MFTPNWRIMEKKELTDWEKAFPFRMYSTRENRKRGSGIQTRTFVAQTSSNVVNNCTKEVG